MKFLLFLYLATVVTSFCPRPQPTRFATILERVKPDKENVEKDMKEAGQAERESEDWVAQDMERLGSQGGDEILEKAGWVAKDMLKAGQGAAHHPIKRKDSEVKNKKNWDITKDMKQTGKSADWIAKDMEEAGRPKFATDHWFNKLDQELDKKEETRKDIKQDMEKTGRMGSAKNLEVRADMERTGRATNPIETIQGFFEGITYQLNEWTEKAFKQDDIEKDMKQAGKAQDQTWMTSDLKSAGSEGTDHGRQLPKQKNELTDDLTGTQHEDYVAKDMKLEGKPEGALHTRTRAKHNRNDLVYDDMKLAGGAGVSEERVREDMELTGHGEGSFYTSGMAGGTKSSYNQEIEEFKKMPHARPKAPVEAKEKGDYTGGTKKEQKETETETKTKMKTTELVAETTEEEIEHEGLAKHLFKKLVHPFTSWKDL